jgi:topoisomerase IA-like protein
VVATRHKVGRAMARRSFKGSDVGTVTSVDAAELMVKTGGSIAKAKKKAAKKKKEAKKRAADKASRRKQSAKGRPRGV